MDELKNIISSKMYDILDRAGINTAKEIIIFSKWDIQKVTNMKEDDITLLKSIVNTHFCPLIITADRLEQQHNITSGCAGIDAVLNGGFRIGTLYEVYGESGTGKSQLAMQVAAHAGKNGSVYICTEDVFPVKRFNELSLNLHRTSDYQQHMFLEHVTEAKDLISCIRVRLPKLLQHNKVSIIIIDSIAAPFRVDVTNYIQRAEELRELGILLLNLAQKYSLAVICINQVTSAFDETDNVLPTLGLSWSNMISYRLLLKKTSTELHTKNRNFNIRELVVIFGPDLSNKVCKFIVDSNGIKDIK